MFCPLRWSPEVPIKRPRPAGNYVRINDRRQSPPHGTIVGVKRRPSQSRQTHRPRHFSERHEGLLLLEVND